MDHSVQELVIVGGGIAGLATAVALKRVGKKSLVLELWPELRESGAAISLFPNAWRALDALGVAHKLRPHYCVIQSGRVTNLMTGETQRQLFSPSIMGGEDKGLRLVHRKALLEAIADELPQNAIRFSSKVISIRREDLQDTSSVYVLQFEDGDIIRAKVVIGCDGAHSVVAQWLGLTTSLNVGRSQMRGLAVFPQGHGLEEEFRQFIWMDKRAAMIPLNKHDVYWFITHLTVPKVKEIGRQPELIQREVRENLSVEFPQDFKDVVWRSELTSLTWDPIFVRAPWDVLLGRAQRGCVTVVGDAMHPMTPDLGQGGCIALEDAVVLARCLARAASPKEVREGMARYVAARRWRVAGVVAAAYLTGYVQQAQAGLWGGLVRSARDFLFYRFILQRVVRLADYDCGSLPIVE